jgi:hypothetical protein
MSRVVVGRIIPVEARENADTLARVEGSKPVSDTARRAGYHRGLKRAEHVVRRETRELGRACDLLVDTDPEDEGYRVTKSPGVPGELLARGEPRGTQSAEANKVLGSERERSDPRGSAGGLSGA